jgi:hypothetical protein
MILECHSEAQIACRLATVEEFFGWTKHVFMLREDFAKASSAASSVRTFIVSLFYTPSCRQPDRKKRLFSRGPVDGRDHFAVRSMIAGSLIKPA